jgi:23S rRNA pseudouridine1911/1915/1917 synthase
MEIPTVLKPNSKLFVTIPEGSASSRLDTILTKLLPAYSRNFFQNMIKEGYVLLNDRKIVKPSWPTKPLDTVTINFPPKRIVAATTVTEMVNSKNLDIEIVYEHEHFLIVYKPANIMVHAPSERSSAVTLVDWLLVHYPDISKVGYSDRPGIVHRIDKDTSGLLVVPRTPHAYATFSKIFKDHAIQKKYWAVVDGTPDKAGTIEIPIGRSPQGNKMAAFPEYTTSVSANYPIIARSPYSSRRIRYAITHYTVKEYFQQAALIEATIVTGRTHQIRVHCAAIGHAILGDPIYGRKSKLIKRQALHAHSLSFNFDGHVYNFYKDVPQDFQSLLDHLRK